MVASITQLKKDYGLAASSNISLSLELRKSVKDLAGGQ
jgi:hypothetical protein